MCGQYSVEYQLLATAQFERRAVHFAHLNLANLFEQS